jgi:4-hydroxybenzoate polyprenyltransferase
LAFLTRPLLICVSITFFFAGAAHGLSSPLEALTLTTLIAVAPNLLLLVLIVASSFVINQVYDVESDALNEKNFILTSGLVSRKEAVVFYAALSIAALLLALLMPSPVRELGAAGLVLGCAYSVRPLRLKGKPIADMLANGLGFGFLGFALGWLALLPYDRALLIRAVPYVAAMCAIFLNTTIPDEAGDRRAGDRTTCVALGRAGVSGLAAIVLTASAVLGFVAGEARCAIAALASLPAFIAVAVEPSSPASVVASQFAGRAFFVVVSVAFPPFALLGGLIYWLSKIYYARRFGLDYPRVGGASAKGRRSPGPQGSYRNT